MPKSALVLGPTGRVGRHAIAAFTQAGWDVTPFRRGTDDLNALARGSDIIVNGWNPAYPDWARDLPGQTQAICQAAEAAGATVVLPGNVYVYGAGSPERLTPETPHRAENPLGRLRRDMEAAYRASRAQVILLRAGDFLDSEASGNWFDRIIAAKLGKGRLVYPGTPDIPHAWAWLPDLARAAERLADQRGALGSFTEVAFPGYTLTGLDLADAARTVLGREIRLTRMSWLPLVALSPVWRMARHLTEMRYLWDMPHRLDGTGLEALLPDFRTTPRDQALATAVRSLGLPMA